MMRDHESRDLEGAAHFAAADAEPPERPHPSEYEDDRWWDEQERQAWKADRVDGLYYCVTCGENTPRFGTRCERCKRNLEEDRLDRESGR